MNQCRAIFLTVLPLAVGLLAAVTPGAAADPRAAGSKKVDSRAAELKPTDTAELKAGPGVAARKFTREEESDWHYREGLRLKKLGRIDEAMDHWAEALRLQPGREDVRKELRAALKESTAADAAPAIPPSELAAIKAAVKQFADSKTFFDLSDILTERSANDIALDLMASETLVCRQLIAQLPTDDNRLLVIGLDQFLNKNRLMDTLRHHPLPGIIDPKVEIREPPLLEGRELLYELGKWAKGICHSTVIIYEVRPKVIKRLADQTPRLTYTPVGENCVEISGFNVPGLVPLEARKENGKWRIGALDGYVFADYFVNYHFHYPASDASQGPSGGALAGHM
jgi:hypothetical protein